MLLPLFHLNILVPDLRHTAADEEDMHMIIGSDEDEEDDEDEEEEELEEEEDDSDSSGTSKREKR